MKKIITVIMFFYLASSAFPQGEVSKEQKKFFTYIEKSDVKNARKLLEKGNIDVNAYDEIGRTALIIAIENNSLEVINFLLEVDVDLNKKSNPYIYFSTNDNGEPLLDSSAQWSYDSVDPLILAIRKENIEIVKLLIDNGVELNKTYPNPLVEAYKINNMYIGELLIDSGANFMFYPIYAGTISFDFLKLVLDDYGFPVNEWCNESMSYFSDCFLTDSKINLENLIYLISKVNKVNSKDKKSLIWFVLDAYYNQIINDCDKIYDFIELVIKKGADINGVVQGETSLYLAISNSDLNMIDFLIKCGADINQKIVLSNADGGKIETHVLFTVVESGDLQVLDYLIRKSINLNVYLTASSNETLKKVPLLALAIQYKKFDIAYKLLDAGANPNLSSFMQNSKSKIVLPILCQALQLDYVPCLLIEKMLKNGMNVNELFLESYNGISSPPLLYALKNKHYEVAKLLLDAGANPNLVIKVGNVKSALLISAIDYAPFWLFAEMIKKGGNINVWSENLGCNLAYYAYASGRNDIYEYLVQLGAKPQKK